MKLNTSIRHTRKVAKNLRICTNDLDIEAKKKDCIIVDTKSIILFL